MTDKPALRATLEALKELKAEYYIGSQNAFNYLKAMRWYEALRQDVIAANPDDPFVRRLIPELTPKRIGQVMDLLRRLICDTLDVISAQKSTLTDWSLAAEHYVYLPTDPATVRRDAPRDAYKWSFSGEWALNVFVRHLSFTDVQLDKLQLNDVFLFLAVCLPENAVEPFLIFEATGERVSLQQFSAQPRFRQASSEGWAGAAIAYLYYGEDLEEDEIRFLNWALANDDAVASHNTLQRVKVRERMAGLESNVSHALEEWGTDNASANDWLYDRKLWERAGYELTLGHLEMERRIVLNAAHRYQLESQSFSSAADFVTWLIEEFRQKLQQQRVRLAIFEKARAPSKILESERKMVEECRYTMLALLQNRKWLIEFLSR